MVLKIYNTLTRKKEEFQPIKKDQVGLYCCGPTVYWYQHIGNLRTYVNEDVLRRILVHDKYKVNHIINITDVGHLTSDADEGEDKLVKALKREKLPLTKEAMLKLANIYFDEFKKDFKRLHILKPYKWTKATEHVKEMIELIKKIEENGYAYKTNVGLIYDTSKFKDYKKLGKLNLQQLEEGARGEKDPERKNPSDFALWITNQPNHIMQWPTPWGKGFPGWHIECCAMSIKYLGEQFDIHCGGKEHIPIHHTNEIAQAEAATGKHPWVKYWMHNEWLVLKDGKMSKSKGTFYRVSDLIEKGYDPLAYRYLCFTAHYRTPLTFSWEALDAAETAYSRLKEKVIEIKNNLKSKENKNNYEEDFFSAVNDDLDMPKALSILWALLKDDQLGNKEKYDILLKFDKILGFGFKDMKEEKIEVSEEIKSLVEEREKARKEKDFKKADEIRDKLKEKGYIVEDSKQGPRIKKI
jgi:cysteinyl-tRNA synthetase